MDIRDKVIIITGASAGIGLASARLLAQRGARVALVARSREKLDALAKELPGSKTFVCDMSDESSVNRMIDAARDHFGRIDVLINNAGQGIYGAGEKVNVANYRKVWELNVIGPLVAMQRVIPIMREQGGGMIINISSMVSKNYIPRLAAYASTKYALNALSLTMRTELEPDHIMVSVVHPGLTDTEFGKNAYRDGEETRGMESRSRPDMPAADSPEHVASRILYAIESGDPEVYMHE